MAENLAEAEILARLDKALARMPTRRHAIFLSVRLDRAEYAEFDARMGLTVRQVEHEVAAALLHIDDVLRGRRSRPRSPRWLARLVGGAGF